MTRTATEGRKWSLVAPLAIALGVFAAAMLSGRLLQLSGTSVAVMRASAGFAFAVLALSPRWAWPRLLVALFSGLCAANLINGWSPTSVVVLGLASTVEAAVAAVVLGHQSDLRAIDSTRVLRFLASAVIGVSAGCGVLFLLVLLDGRSLDIIRGYALSHITAMVVIGPAVLVVGAGHASWNPRAGRHLEAAAAACVAILTVLAVFSPWVDAPISFLVIIPLLWSASRLGLGFASLVTIAVCVVAAAGTVNDGGPFVVIASPFLRVVTLQVQLICLSVMSMVLAMAADRHESDLATLRGVAFIDQLTGLANRRQLDIWTNQAASEGARGGLLFVDLDGFKNVNDTAGHRAGDEVLKQVSDRLMASVRDTDRVARLGGDEFAVLLLEARDTDHLAEIGARLTEAFSAPFLVEGREWQVGLSLGGVMMDPAATTDQMLSRADHAMYQAKEAGGRRLVIHGPDGRQASPSAARTLFVSPLERAGGPPKG